MKIILIYISILIVSTSLMAQPKLEIVQDKFDFGMIPNHSTVAQNFWFKSIGDDTLKITEIKTGCTCAIMPLKQDFILPGDSMEVRFLWDVGNRVFKIGRYPYIFTNAKEEPYRMSLTGEVHPSFDSLKPVSLSPYKCELSKIYDKSINQIEFTFTNNTDKDINFRIISSPVEECTIEIPELISANGKAVGTIKVNEEFLDKEFKGSVTIQLDDFKKTRISIPFRRKFY